MKLFMFFLLLFMSATSSAQVTGRVRYLIDQSNGYFEVLLNDKLITRTYRDTLDVGVYKAKIWSPGYKMVDTSFIIKENIETIVFIKMKLSKEFYSRSRSNVLRNKKRTTFFRLPMAVSLGGFVSTAYFSAKAIKVNKDVDLFIQDYNKKSNQGAVLNFKEELLLMQNSYNLNRKRLYTGLIVGGIGAGISMVGLRYLNKKYPFKALFEEDSPFANKLSICYNINSINISFNL
ncbi:hypothetical protein DNU06_01235 [Putridiphycobacter roseus]|uniref:PEGA domain-containing protein n=1 Tax=Putridiphycobacter roseus TaxID=2219161 RepID=A0A2W1NG65_9FLAO|nr:hypothetical protein [Putridiphycobacter roseus]PZE18485.1 hypothetical protein DNU06_01235 [Putridiphycobacter roseus]